MHERTLSLQNYISLSLQKYCAWFCFSFDAYRSITELSRKHNLFSLATPTAANAFLIFKNAASDVVEFHVGNKRAGFGAQDYKLNMWHFIYSTQDPNLTLSLVWCSCGLMESPQLRNSLAYQTSLDPLLSSDRYF